MAESTSIGIQRPPEEALPFLYGNASPGQYAILPEVEALYQARRLTPEQIAQLQMPDQQVAGRTPLQGQAGQLIQSGIGSYMPMLQAGAGTIGSGVSGIGTAMQTLQQGYNPLAAAESMITGAYEGSVPFRDYAISQLQGAIPAVQQAAGQGATGIEAAAARGELAAAGGVRGIADAATQAQLTGQQTAQNIMAAGSPAGGIGQFGMDAAQSGIQSLQGSSAAFDPNTIADYMNPYEQAVIDAALGDVARAGERQRNTLDAQAVAAGAFGGSRQGIESAELTRNILEQQGRTASNLRQAGYESASQRAQAAYEAAKARQIQGAGLTGQLGQAGAATGLQATQVGLGAAQQAGQAQMQGTQMGMQGAQQAAQTGLAGAQLGLTGAGQAAQMRTGAAGQAAGLGSQVGTMGAQYGQMGLAGAGQMGALAGQYGSLGQGIGTLSGQLGGLGMQQAQLGEAQQGLNLNDANTLLSFGAQEQQQRQAELDAAYQNQYQQYQQPYQNLGFYSDIFQGMPIGQSTFTQQQTPNPSTISQLGGLATGLYGMYRATQ
ncbi:MAG: hypothetical protein K0U55_12780 [Gammaproteobacteria bacterium]|nr:hypothetical protein [Gammaproteobacteria bacterium]